MILSYVSKNFMSKKVLESFDIIVILIYKYFFIETKNIRKKKLLNVD